MSSPDLLGIAIDWLDAYRAGDLFIVDFYAEDASLHCDCAGNKQLRGAPAIAAYWHQRLAETPANDLIDLQWDGSDVILHFAVPDGVVKATLTFDADGALRRSRCEPWNN
jgi:hypothetical protein